MAEVDLNELERYLRIFQENPDSRVFAPLADLYRRLGRLKEAEEICREGIQRHPYYAGGRVALAHVLLDSGRLPDALREGEAVVTYYPDNLLARKILVRVLGGLGQADRARRELEALRALAPQVASDPELERALEGPSKAAELPASPQAEGANLSNLNKNSWPQSPREVAEATALEGLEEGQTPPPLHTFDELGARPQAVDPTLRSLRLRRLFRKKAALEAMIRSLGDVA